MSTPPDIDDALPRSTTGGEDTRIESADDPTYSGAELGGTGRSGTGGPDAGAPDAGGSKGVTAQPLPEAIGPYRILSLLGTGGMGTVFLAEQIEPVRRQVALKVIRSRYSTEEGRLRFETERQAMARLQHPNVAQIFEAGTTEDGHPYFVMERVDGVSLTEYCQSQRLPISKRLSLFKAVCAGVHHAHQKGIIHRDLKPSNVLVTEDEGRPVPKIIDFGIAKTFGDDEISSSQVTGDRMIGTPAYVSPEAAQLGRQRLDVDTRSDVYSLGILLHELLIGCRPFDNNEGLFDLLKQISEGEAASPRELWQSLAVEKRNALANERRSDSTTIGHRLRGDLEWIVLKAIHKDRQLRYDSAAAFAADIERHLKHEPVEAGPPSKIYRLRKFIRRRSGIVAGLAGVVLALGIGLAARTMEATRANREAEAAVAARLETEEALRVAEKARAEAAEVSNFLIDLFKVSDPGQSQGNTVTARELLDDAARKVEHGFDDQPVARARFMQTIADVYRKLGLFEPARELAQSSLSLRRQHLPPRHPDTAASLSGLAALYASLGRFTDAEPLLQEALEIREHVLEENDPAIASTLNDLANVYDELGRSAEAEPLYLRSIEINRGRPGPLEAEHLVAMNNLAVYFSEQGRYAEAEPLLRGFLQHLEEAHGRTHPYVAFALENLADIRGKQGGFDEAKELFGQAEEILVEVLGADHPEVAYCLRLRGDLFRAAGQTEPAEEDYRRALAIQRAALPADHPEIKETLVGLESLRATPGLQAN